MRAYFIYVYCDITVLTFGIIGNILVIMSILRQQKLLENNCYFLVFQLAICDLGVQVIYLGHDIITLSLETNPYEYFVTYRFFFHIRFLFQVTGICLMLVITMLRYRATLHPLKPAMSRRKLKIVCSLVYAVGLIAGYGPTLSLSLLYEKDRVKFYDKFHVAYIMPCYYLLPKLVMAVIYLKICRELIQQNKYIKNICSNPLRQTTPYPSFNILSFLRNRRTSFVSFCTVLCYGVGNIPVSVWFSWHIFGEHHLLKNYTWVEYFAYVFRVFCSHALNPVIYGTLDKKLLAFWKLCFKRKF